MKLLKLCALLLLIGCSQIGEAQAPGSGRSEEGLVYYFGFDIERITGIPESQIEDYGCLFKITQNNFQESLSAAEGGATKYNKLDVRAKAVFGNKQYFLDRSGIVRTGDRYFSLNKKSFVSHLLPVRKCSPAT